MARVLLMRRQMQHEFFQHYAFLTPAYQAYPTDRTVKTVGTWYRILYTENSHRF